MTLLTSESSRGHNQFSRAPVPIRKTAKTVRGSVSHLRLEAPRPFLGDSPLLGQLSESASITDRRQAVSARPGSHPLPGYMAARLRSRRVSCMARPAFSSLAAAGFEERF